MAEITISRSGAFEKVDPLDKKEAEFHFQEANRLYKEGYFLEALRHLSELEGAYPNTFNILFPMLLCKQKLGHIHEAYEQCAAMLEKFTEGKHQARLRSIFAQLCRGKTSAQASTVSSNQGLISDPPDSIPLKKTDVLFVGGFEIPWVTILVGISIIALFFGVLALAPPMLTRIEKEMPGTFKEIIFGFVLLIQSIFSFLIIYATLWTLNKLPNGELIRDLLDIGVFQVIFWILCLIPVVGWILAYYHLSERYDLGLGEIVIFFLLQVVFQMFFIMGILPSIFDENATAIRQLFF